ncbi:MAG: sulfurtransferase [Woeseiaceae bacterium]|nr:sulfurtransferase [Woeseiaceae bacterium]
MISAEELQQSLGRTGLSIVDCRFSLLDPAAGRRQYDESHIPGAVYADLERDLSGAAGPNTGRHPLPDAADACRRIGALGIGNDTAVVVYDDAGGGIAGRAWWLLRWLGHENARLLDGGFAAWKHRGLAVETGPAEIVPRQFKGAPRADLVLETDEIALDGVTDAPYRLVDAREAARFLGIEEPIDPVAGHIPGAWNMPFAENLDASKHWKAPGELSATFEKLLGLEREEEWAVMCGSGVTACHLVIAALTAGYREPRVYVGSWSEWIRDRARAVATGPR